MKGSYSKDYLNWIFSYSVSFHLPCTKSVQGLMVSPTGNNMIPWTLLKAAASHFDSHTRHEIQTLQPPLYVLKAAPFHYLWYLADILLGSRLKSHSAHYYFACLASWVVLAVASAPALNICSVVSWWCSFLFILPYEEMMIYIHFTMTKCFLTNEIWNP